MIDRPYTDDDLRAEAARQHRGLTRTADLVVVGDQMDQETVPSTENGDEPRTWAELLGCEGDITPAYEEAQEVVHRLITRAADVSVWAVNLGADGLEPDGTLQLGVRGPNPGDPEQPVVRLHFAFPKGMSHDDRSHLLMRLSGAMAKAL